MATFEKKFIGKGTKHSQFDIITCSIDMEKASPFIFEYEGKKYLRFEVAQRQNPDSFGKTHSIYLTQRTENEPQETQNANQQVTSDLPEPVLSDDLPF